VEKLRKHGVLQACPLCREALPAGSEKLNEDAIRMYVTLKRKVESGKASWHTLTDSQQSLMSEVVAMFTDAANQGYADAQYSLGYIYHDGEGVSKDPEKSALWTWNAAEQGHADAQYNLGIKYGEGDGVSKDPEEGARWTLKAAEQGHADAQHNLACAYAEGIGVTQDLQESALWTRKAAEQGRADAQFDLGLMYRDGVGVTQDLQESALWTRKAAEQGDTDAQRFLLELAPDVSKEALSSTSSHQCACCGRGRENKSETQVLLSVQDGVLLWRKVSTKTLERWAQTELHPRKG